MSNFSACWRRPLTPKIKDACNAQFAEILAEQTALKKQKEAILQSSAEADRVCTRMIAGRASD